MSHLWNDRGAVLLTVIILSVVLSVVVIGIMSLNVSQVKSSQSVIDELKAEYLAQGYFYQYYQEKVTTGSASLPAGSKTLDGKTFTAATTNTVGIYDTEQVNLNLQF
jgi:Tfp pilus assembly protein PilX